jgi:hypothetical protein
MMLKPDFPLEDHISAFNYKQLQGFFGYCSQFNFVEDVYVRRDKGNHLLANIKQLVVQDKLKFEDLNMDVGIVTLKNLLASFIFLSYAFGHHYSNEDCLTLKSKVMD